MNKGLIEYILGEIFDALTNMANDFLLTDDIRSDVPVYCNYHSNTISEWTTNGKTPPFALLYLDSGYYCVNCCLNKNGELVSRVYGNNGNEYITSKTTKCCTEDEAKEFYVWLTNVADLTDKFNVPVSDLMPEAELELSSELTDMEYVDKLISALTEIKEEFGDSKTNDKRIIN